MAPVPTNAPLAWIDAVTGIDDTVRVIAVDQMQEVEMSSRGDAPVNAAAWPQRSLGWHLRAGRAQVEHRHEAA